MQRSRLLLALSHLAVVFLPAVAGPPDLKSEGQSPPTSPAPIERLAFGSCIKEDREIEILETVLSETPEIVLLTGDNIYGDTEDISLLRRKYARLDSNAAFQKLRTGAHLLATWDDHDFGLNDGGADYAKREESRDVFLDFIRVPLDSPRRDRDGVYHSETFGPPGKRLQIILLDTRFNRSPLKKGVRRVGGPYYPDSSESKTVLGEPQWRWLKTQLEDPADIRLIVSSIQFIASDSGQECWANLPKQRERMLQLIQTTRAEGIVFLSGDRHWSEISSLKPPSGYRLYDITCSSLNQMHGRGTPTDNVHRLGKTTYHQMNYGILSIDWDHRNGPLMRFSVRDLKGKDQITLQIRRSDLEF